MSTYKGHDPSEFSDRELVEHLQTAPHLNDWERGYSDSVLSWVNRGGKLTDRQRSVVVRILKKGEV